MEKEAYWRGLFLVCGPPTASSFLFLAAVNTFSDRWAPRGAASNAGRRPPKYGQSQTPGHVSVIDGVTAVTFPSRLGSFTRLFLISLPRSPAQVTR